MSSRFSRSGWACGAPIFVTILCHKRVTSASLAPVRRRSLPAVHARRLPGERIDLAAVAATVERERVPGAARAPAGTRARPGTDEVALECAATGCRALGARGARCSGRVAALARPDRVAVTRSGRQERQHRSEPTVSRAHTYRPRDGSP